ncbi:MAG TPA: YitT family protein [Lachnospiraceae bacterium]|nr:YitT family protein [Lachnospiraceae bacterium]
MQKGDIASKVMNVIFMIVGTMFIATAITVFFSPNQVVVGGFSGIGIIVKNLTVSYVDGGVPLSVTNLVLNIPLFVIAYFVLGKSYLGKTIFATIFLSAALEMTSFLPVFKGDLALISIYGGIVDGIGLGFVLRAMASTGGVDLLATIIHNKMKHISISSIMFVINSLVIAFGLFVFGAEKAMYAVISIFVSSKCITVVLEGLSFSKMAFIISEQSEKIAREIMKQHNRGVTALNGRGMYTGKNKEVLLCVFKQKEITGIKEIVRNADPNAFIILTDIKEVMGEGFKKLDSVD